MWGKKTSISPRGTVTKSSIYQAQQFQRLRKSYTLREKEGDFRRRALDASYERAVDSAIFGSDMSLLYSAQPKFNYKSINRSGFSSYVNSNFKSSYKRSDRESPYQSKSNMPPFAERRKTNKQEQSQIQNSHSSQDSYSSSKNNSKPSGRINQESSKSTGNINQPASLKSQAKINESKSYASNKIEKSEKSNQSISKSSTKNNSPEKIHQSNSKRIKQSPQKSNQQPSKESPNSLNIKNKSKDSMSGLQQAPKDFPFDLKDNNENEDFPIMPELHASELETSSDMKNYMNEEEEEYYDTRENSEIPSKKVKIDNSQNNDDQFCEHMKTVAQNLIDASSNMKTGSSSNPHSEITINSKQDSKNITTPKREQSKKQSIDVSIAHSASSDFSPIVLGSEDDDDDESFDSIPKPNIASPSPKKKGY